MLLWHAPLCSLWKIRKKSVFLNVLAGNRAQGTAYDMKIVPLGTPDTFAFTLIYKAWQSLENHWRSSWFGKQGWLVVIFFRLGKLLFSPLAAESLSISTCSSLQRDYRGGDTKAGALAFIPLTETYSVASWSPAWAWLHLLPLLTHWFNSHRLLAPQQMPADINKNLPLDSKGLCVSLLRYMD